MLDCAHRQVSGGQLARRHRPTSHPLPLSVGAFAEVASAGKSSGSGPLRRLGLGLLLTSLLSACAVQASGKMSSTGSFKAGRDSKLKLTPEPSTVDRGETVLLKGSLKGVEASELAVGFSGTSARVKVAEFRDDGLVVIVPEGAQTGGLRVFEGDREVWAGRVTVRGTTEGETSTADGGATPAATTSAAQPTTTSVVVTRMEPNPAPAGAQVTLHGRFSEVTAERVAIRLSGVSEDLAPADLKTDRLIFALPPSAKTGAVLVSVDGYAVWRGTLTIN